MVLTACRLRMRRGAMLFLLTVACSEGSQPREPPAAVPPPVRRLSRVDATANKASEPFKASFLNEHPTLGPLKLREDEIATNGISLTPLVFDGKKLIESPWLYTDDRLLVTWSPFKFPARQMGWEVVVGVRFDDWRRSLPSTGWPGDEYWGFVDRSGTLVIPPVYYDAHPFSEGLAAVNVSSPETPRWGMIDVQGNVVIPFRYDWLGLMSEGLVAFAEEDKFGYMNAREEVQIAPRFGAAGAFHNGRARVLRESRYAPSGKASSRILEINRAGRVIGRADSAVYALDDFDALFDEEPHPYQDKTSRMWGYRDARGAIVVAPRFAHAGRFNEGVAPVTEDFSRRECGYIDKSGQLVVKLPYKMCGQANDGRILARGIDADGERYEWAVYDLEGNLVFDRIEGYEAHPPLRLPFPPGRNVIRRKKRIRK